MLQTQGFNDCNIVDSEILMEALRRKLLLAVFLGPPICAWGADANQDDLEYQLKATFLYKFASYVEWPATASAQTNTFFTIGVVGADKVVVALNSLTGAHPVNNRPLQVKAFKAGEPVT